MVLNYQDKKNKKVRTQENEKIRKNNIKHSTSNKYIIYNSINIININIIKSMSSF